MKSGFALMKVRRQAPDLGSILSNDSFDILIQAGQEDTLYFENSAINFFKGEVTPEGNILLTDHHNPNRRITIEGGSDGFPEIPFMDGGGPGMYWLPDNFESPNWYL